MLSIVDLACNSNFQVLVVVTLGIYLLIVHKNSEGLSIIEGMQQRAQEKEMDHTNTSPTHFILLSAVQLPIILFLSYYFFDDWCSFSFSIIGCTAVISHFAGFVLSVAIKSNMFFDITGEITFASLLAYAYFQIPSPSPRQQLAFTFAGIWVVRLGWFLFYRILKRGGRDWRFDKLVKGHAYNAFGWICQGSWIWLNGFCLWLLAGVGSNSAITQKKIGFMGCTGAAIFVLGLLIEIVADHQKSMWNKRMKFGHDKQTCWIQEGLWRYSRHPNFFGEILLWGGLALLCMEGLPTYLQLLALVSPVWSGFFLIFTSLMLLEKRLNVRFDGQKDYELYKQRTSVLIPWFLDT